jgi:transcriptional regulator with XRE-family HTH domain
MDLGQAIKTLRMKQGMTQKQLADKCAMSTNAICSLETGKAYPPKGTIMRLCRALEVPTSYLLVASIEETDIPEEKRVLYRVLLEPLRNELLETKEQ